jgi:uncharacterized repeat protein (TIGR02543 family)
MNNREKKAARLAILLCAGLVLLGGCKDLFHPEGSEEEPPSAPSGVTASAQSASSIYVSWNWVSEAVGYYVYRANSSDGYYSYVTATYESYYTDTGLSSNTRYYYKVSAYNDYGESSQSSYDYATTSGTAPSTPTSVSASAQSSSSITVSWGSVSGASSYYVYRATSYNGSYTQITSTSNTSYTDTGLSPNTTYYYKVSAWNSAYGEGPQSSWDSATTGETLYTVTFNADGGSPATQTKTVTSGSSVGSSNMPSTPTKSGYSFGGWYTSTGGGGSQFTATTTVTGNITVYAQWGMPDNLSLNDTLAWISNNAVTGDTYTITLRNNEAIAPKSLSYSGKTVDITLTGGSTERTVSLSTIGSLFTVGSGVTLTLGNNVTLQGRSDNTASLVWVDSGGTLVMNTGSKISGNTKSSGYGGGVYVGNGGIFTMNGGIINGNSASHSSAGAGGGVAVGGDGAFTMGGGTISGNTALWGGGVFVGGTFTMGGGTISGNTASIYYGGGVYVQYGTFTKQSGGVIYGSNESNSALRNTASGSSYGHVAYVYSSSQKRNNTAGVGITMNSGITGSAGGWE